MEMKFASKEFMAHVCFLFRIVVATMITVIIHVFLASLNAIDGASPIVPAIGFATVTVALYAFVFSGGAIFLGTSVFKTSKDEPPFHQSLYWFVCVSLSLADLYFGGVGFLAGAVFNALDRSLMGLKTHDNQSRYSPDLNLYTHFERTTTIASPQASRGKSTSRSNSIKRGKSNKRSKSPLHKESQGFDKASLCSWLLDASPYEFSSDLAPLGLAFLCILIRFFVGELTFNVNEE